MNVSRHLLTFAFVADKYTQSGNIATGLLPLFAPLMAKRDGALFDPDVFVQDLADTYAISMHPYVAEYFIEPLEANGMLVRMPGPTKQRTAYRCRSTEAFSAPVNETEIQEVLRKFREFANLKLSLHGISVDDEVLDVALTNRLINAEFQNVARRPDRLHERGGRSIVTLRKGDNGVDGGTSEAELDFRLDVLAASFLIHAHAHYPDLFGIIEKITMGALVSEVVLDLQHPPEADQTAPNLAVFLDGPLILDALGLGEDKHSEYARLLIKQLLEAGIQLYTFPHVVEEMRNAIDATVRNLSTNGDAYGPLAQKVRRQPAALPYALSIVQSLSDRVTELNITVHDMSAFELASRARHFPKPQEESLAGNIGLYGSIETRQRDALSIASVVRLREGKGRGPNLFRSTAVFVTRNKLLADSSRAHLVRTRVLPQREVPPCITDRQLAGLMWITFGGQSAELPRSRLLANCATAIQPRRDVIGRMLSFLHSLDDEKAVRFDAMMRDERATCFLMERTLGDYGLITQENVLAIYEEMRKEFLADLAEEKARDVAHLEAQFAQQAAAEESRVQAEIGQLQNLLAQERVRREQAEIDASLTMSEVESLEGRIERSERRAIERCLARAHRAGERIQSVLGIGVAVVSASVPAALVLAGTLNMQMACLATFSVMLILELSVFFGREWSWYQRIYRWRTERVANRLLAREVDSEVLTRFEIDIAEKRVAPTSPAVQADNGLQ